MFEEIYEREKDLELEKYKNKKICVIGVGGIGSWTALNFALWGIKKLILVDNDKVSMHNLNRTIFRLKDVNKFKVDALKEIIYERRLNCDVVSIRKTYEQLNRNELKLLDECDYIIDCCDRVLNLREEHRKKNIIRVGYDAFNLTIHFNKHKNSINLFGEGGNGYVITPSVLFSPLFASLVIVMYTVFDNIHFEQEKITKIDIKEVIEWLKEKSI